MSFKYCQLENQKGTEAKGHHGSMRCFCEVEARNKQAPVRLVVLIGYLEAKNKSIASHVVEKKGENTVPLTFTCCTSVAFQAFCAGCMQTAFVTCSTMQSRSHPIQACSSAVAFCKDIILFIFEYCNNISTQ